jgi:hypothetical protein
MMTVNECVEAYEIAKNTLSDLIVRQKKNELRILQLRQEIRSLAIWCEGRGIQVAPSAEADYLLKNAALADEIRSILKSASPGFVRPYQIKLILHDLGHNMDIYSNPQSMIQMLLKRMAESGEVQIGLAPNGKLVYRIVTFKCDDEMGAAMNEVIDKQTIKK